MGIFQELLTYSILRYWLYHRVKMFDWTYFSKGRQCQFTHHIQHETSNVKSIVLPAILSVFLSRYYVEVQTTMDPQLSSIYIFFPSNGKSIRLRCKINVNRLDRFEYKSKSKSSSSCHFPRGEKKNTGRIFLSLSLCLFLSHHRHTRA